MFYLKIVIFPNQMINVCAPNGGPIVTHLITEVQVNNGNITSMTLDQMLQDTQYLEVRAL